MSFATKIVALLRNLKTVHEAWNVIFSNSKYGYQNQERRDNTLKALIESAVAHGWLQRDAEALRQEFEECKPSADFSIGVSLELEPLRIARKRCVFMQRMKIFLPNDLDQLARIYGHSHHAQCVVQELAKVDAIDRFFQEYDL